jgi:hypothetical protein
MLCYYRTQLLTVLWRRSVFNGFGLNVTDRVNNMTVERMDPICARSILYVKPESNSIYVLFNQLGV